LQGKGYDGLKLKYTCHPNLVNLIEAFYAGDSIFLVYNFDPFEIPLALEWSLANLISIPFVEMSWKASNIFMTNIIEPRCDEVSPRPVVIWAQLIVAIGDDSLPERDTSNVVDAISRR
jgi:hypothetical protein